MALPSLPPFAPIVIVHSKLVVAGASPSRSSQPLELRFPSAELLLLQYEALAHLAPHFSNPELSLLQRDNGKLNAPFPTPSFAMAPVDPDVSNDNSWPITIFTTRLLLTGGLLAYNVASLRRTSGALPPAHETRQQQLVRRRKVMLFAILAALSALIISYFAIAWRVLEYRTWAEEAGDKKPYSIWRGWYGTPNDPMELQLGRWMQDVNLMTRGTQLQVRSPRGLYWTQMQMLGTLSWSIFVGIEGMEILLCKVRDPG